MTRPILAVTADVHVHPHREFNTYDGRGRSSRVEAAVAALRQVFEYADRHEAQVAILGDLLHVKGHVPVEVIDPLLGLRGEFSHVPTWILAGNHERPDRFSEQTTLGWLERDPTWIVVDSVCVRSDVIDDVDVYFLPYCRDEVSSASRLRELVSATSAERPHRRRLLLGHGTVDGARTQDGVRLSNPNLTPESLWLASFNLTLFGDVHHHQNIALLAHYVGALLPQNFGERYLEPGFVVVNDDLSWERVAVEAPQFRYAADAGDLAVNHHRGGLGDDYVRPAPEAVFAAPVGAPEAADVDLSDLHALVAAYVAACPPPDGVSVDAVQAAVAAAAGARP